MKRLIILFVLMITVVIAGFAAEDVATYEYMYNAAPSYLTQLDVLREMVQTKPADAGEFYARALRKLLSEYSNIRTSTDRNAVDDQVILLSSLLGDAQYADAAPDLWLAANRFTAPLVKAEALMALGSIRATTYLPQVIRVLESMNSSPPSDRLYGERVAFGAIVALERYQDPTGYLPVYFASTGWYSERTKNQALRSLSIIAGDPTPYMMEVITGASYSYEYKLTAVRAIEASEVDHSSKSSIAVAALGEGWRNNSNDLRLRKVLADMRKLSINMINRYKTDDEAAYVLLAQSYFQGYDSEEKIDVIEALASLATDASAERLTTFLVDLNDKRRSGNIRPEDERMVRAVILALGQTGRADGNHALAAVGSSGWTPAVVALANTVLQR